MALARQVKAYLKKVWDKEPVLVTCAVLGFGGLIIPFISPYTKYTNMISEATPITYPVPLRDDGNMPDVPAHPCEPKGGNLEWLKNL